MKTIAEKIIEDTAGAMATTYAGGYAVMYDGAKRYFPAGRQLAENRNDRGRVTFAKYAYADGSELTFWFNEQRGAKVEATKRALQLA